MLKISAVISKLGIHRAFNTNVSAVTMRHLRNEIARAPRVDLVDAFVLQVVGRVAAVEPAGARARAPLLDVGAPRHPP